MPLQIELTNRERTPTVKSSSMNNSMHHKKMNRKDSIFFINDFVKDKEEESTPLSQYNKEDINFKAAKDNNLLLQDQIFQLFKNNQISKQFVQNIESNKFKPTILVSLLLPFELIKKVFFILTGFQYNNSNINQFLCRKTISYKGLEDVSIMFWILQIDCQQKDIRKSSKHKKQEWKQKTSQLLFANGLRMMIELPHIVITTKKFVQDNLNRFIKTVQSSFQQHKQKKVQQIINIRQNLLYCNTNESHQKQQQNQAHIGLNDILQLNGCFKHIQQIKPKTLNSEVLHLQSQQFQSGTNQFYKNSSYQQKSSSSFKKKNKSVSQFCNQFKWIFHQTIILTLKQNWQYTNCISTWFSLHLYSNMYKIFQKESYATILQLSLKNFKKEFQTKYMFQIEKITQVLDQFKLRNILQNIRKQLVIELKKNMKNIMIPKSLKSLQHNNSKIGRTNSLIANINREYIQNVQYQIMEFISKQEKNIYNENNRKAIEWNQNILASSYQTVLANMEKQVALRKTQSLGVSSNSIRISQIDENIIRENIQKDFQNFMEQYLNKGIKVSSQLKTFNSFMEKNKANYLNKINKLFSKRGFRQNEAQQREEKEQVLKCLQLEVQLLEEKKKQVEEHNKNVKKIINKNLQEQQKQKQKQQKSIIKKKSLNQKFGNKKQSSKQLSEKGSIKGSGKEQIESSGRPMHRTRFGQKKLQQTQHQGQIPKQKKCKCCQIM